MALPMMLAGVSHAQETADTFVVNLRGADISVLAEQVSEITGRTLVLDPGVTGAVTVVSTTELDREGVWALFQSILRSRGFAAVESGMIWQVVPEGEARTIGGSGEEEGPGTQDVVTETLRLSRVPSAEAVRVLRPLVAESGYMEALADPNAILITDTRANVDRILQIAQAFDTEIAGEAEVIRFTYANAAAVGQAIAEVLGGGSLDFSVDPVSNLLLVRGTSDQLDQVRDIARSMDIAPREAPQDTITTSIFRLQFGDAETVAAILQATLGGSSPDTMGTPRTSEPLLVSTDGAAGEEGAFVPVPSVARPAAVTVVVQASVETNAIIVRGTAGQIAEIGQLISALDVRRPQVMIEAAIVEVSGDVAERLGVQLGFGGAAPPNGLAATSFSNGGVSLQGVLAAIGAPATAVLSTGFSASAGGDGFGLLVQALSQSSQARLLSTPSVTTLDNEPATIVVGQNVPFRTGSFATDGNTTTPFTTIERRDVGITMNVVPRITAGGVIELDINQEVSSLANANVEGAADLITNTRVIDTTVLADDRGTVVLGGLISDDRLSQSQRVPGLSEVPVLGHLFRSRNGQATSRTLFVFLRPTILRDAHDIREVAEGRYGRLRAAEVDEPPRTILSQPEVEVLPLEIQGLY